MTSSIQTVEGNTVYEINGSGSGTIDVRMSPNTASGAYSVQQGDFVAVRGVSANPWRMLAGSLPPVSARSDAIPLFIATDNLPGNVAPGQSWTPRLAPQSWQAVSTEPRGTQILAAAAGGQLHQSWDAGNTWLTTNSPVADWSAVHVMYLNNGIGGVSARFMAAAARGGSLYFTGPGGRDWLIAEGTQPGGAVGSQLWEAVIAHAYGELTGAVFNGPIYSSSGGNNQTWVAAVAAGGTTPLVRGWRGLATAAFGGLMAAVNDEGEVWTSTDRGRTFSQRRVVVGGTAVTNAWRNVAVSRDGGTIVIAGRTNSAVYLSSDGGQNWRRSAAPLGDYTGLALSDNGQVIAASHATGVQLSRDGGATFSPAPVPAGSGAWRGVSMAGDGNMLVAASSQLYTSLGNRTAYGDADGGILGRQGDFVEVEFVSAFPPHYRVRSSSPGPFSIR